MKQAQMQTARCVLRCLCKIDMVPPQMPDLTTPNVQPIRGSCASCTLACCTILRLQVSFWIQLLC